MIHILISSALKRLLEISDRYCVILVISYHRPFSCSSLALKPPGLTVRDKVRETCYWTSTTSVYVSLNSFIIYSAADGWRDMKSINNKGADNDSQTCV